MNLKGRIPLYMVLLAYHSSRIRAEIKLQVWMVKVWRKMGNFSLHEVQKIGRLLVSMQTIFSTVKEEGGSYGNVHLSAH